MTHKIITSDIQSQSVLASFPLVFEPSGKDDPQSAEAQKADKAPIA